MLPPKFSICNGLYVGWIDDEFYKICRDIEFHLMSPYHRVGGFRKLANAPGHCMIVHFTHFF